MGCIFCKRIFEESEGPKEEVREPLSPDVVTLDGMNTIDRSNIEQEQHVHSWFGGGIPGVAMTEEESRLPKYTGLIRGGIKSEAKLWWGSYCRAGNDPLGRTKENQDCFCSYDNFGGDPDIAFFCVLDGHGPMGAYASQFVRDKFPKLLENRVVDLYTYPENTLKEAAEVMSRTLKNNSIDTSCSGTTCVSLLVSHQIICVANVGDSRAVLGSYSNKFGYMAVDLSLDHKPDVPEEKQRIENSNGRVFEWGVPRVWLQDQDTPGLAMTRSFGDDIAHEIGVTSEPEVDWMFKEKEHAFIILATDGVWEFLSSEEAVDFVAEKLSRGKDPQEACKELVSESVRRWEEDEEYIVDDITATIVVFQDHKWKPHVAFGDLAPPNFPNPPSPSEESTESKTVASLEKNEEQKIEEQKSEEIN